MARNRRSPPTPPPNPLDELVQLATDLDLTALAAAFPELLTRAEREGLSFTDLALAMLRIEATARRERWLDRNRRRSKLGAVEGLDGFDFAARPQLDPRLVKELLNCRFALEKRNVLCLGRPGLGKTRVAKAVVHAACLAGYTTLSVNTAEMLEEFHAAQADKTHKRVLRRYVKPQVLLCDSCEAPTYVESGIEKPAACGARSLELHINLGGSDQSASSQSRTEASDRQAAVVPSAVPIGPAFIIAARLVSRSITA